jgi:tetratricopeptide (TPR) repeat protein
VAGNPRIEELRKKLDKEPGSRLFAQLAEELRKDGEFEDAIRVAREGLQKHQNYPSARLTLGRALFDTGDWAAARLEFEQVLKGAPDNILASRLLAESLEGLGDVAGAVARYKKTLALAPGDKQILAKLEALEGGGTGAGVPAASVPAAAAARPPAPAIRPSGPAVSAPQVPAEPPPVVDTSAPIRLAEVDAPMELERPFERGAAAEPSAAPEPVPAPTPAAFAAPTPVAPPAAAAVPVTPPPPAVATAPPAPAATAADSGPAPIPVAADDGDFEIERPNEPLRAPVSETPAAPRSAPAVAAAPPPPRAHETPMEFEFDAGPVGSTIPFAPAPAAAPASAPPVEPAVDSRTAAIPVPVVAPPPVAAPRPAESAKTVEMPWVPPPPTSPPPSPPPSANAPAPEGEAASGELMSATLAELYFNQGFTEKAIEVYRQLLEREPENDRLRRRLQELQTPVAPIPAPEPPAVLSTAPAPMAAAPPLAPPSEAATRRVALERTIARLEGMLAAIKKG